MAKQTYRPLPSDALHVEQVRSSIRESRKAPELPQPDTFLGRRTHEPFPSEQRDERQDE